MDWFKLRGRSSKRSEKQTVHSSKSLLHWDEDIAIIFDPVKQKFLRGSVSKIEAAKDEDPFYKIDLPPIAKHLECYVPVGGNSDQKIFLGTINLSKLGTQVNIHRARRKKMSLYIFGHVEAPE